MAYAESPTAPRPRPATVTIASALLYLLAALQVVGAIVALSTVSATRRAIETAFANEPDIDVIATAITVVTVFFAVVALLFAACFVVLGLLNSKGRNAARIVTWVFGGIAMCCFSISMVQILAPASVNVGGTGGTTGPDPAEVSRIIEESQPSWLFPVSVTVQTIELLLLIAALVLLALPPSNAFFRKRSEQPMVAWEPSYPQMPPPPPSQPPTWQQPGSQPPSGSQPQPGSQPPPPPPSLEKPPPPDSNP